MTTQCYSRHKEINKVVQRLIKYGGWIVSSRNRHLKLWHEGEKAQLLVPITPGDGRALKNFLADVRRLGFVTPEVLGHS